MSASQDVSTAEPAARPVRKAATPAPRQNLLLQAVGPALVGLGLWGLSEISGAGWLVAGVSVVQVLLVLALLALLDAPASEGIFAIGVSVGVAANVLAVTEDGDLGVVAGVLALGFIASLMHQLIRRERTRVTESLADTMLVLAITSALACAVALPEQLGGDEALQVCLAAGAACLFAGRIGDLMSARPVLALGSTRGWVGLMLGLAAGAAAGALMADSTSAVEPNRGALLGLAIAATVAATDLAVDLAAAELRASNRDARRVSALAPVSMLLPYAALAPVALVASRLVLP